MKSIKIRKLISAAAAAALTLTAAAISYKPDFSVYDTQTVFAESADSYSEEMTYGDLMYHKYRDTINDPYEYVEITGCNENAEVLDIPDEIDGLPVRAICRSAFYGCESLKEAKLPGTLRVLDHGAFMECTSLTNITLPESLSYCYADVFSRCTSLEHIEVEEGNKIYCSEDGVLYDIKKTTLLVYPTAHKGKTYVMPETVVSIMSGFGDNPYIEEITLSPALSHVPSDAMSYCKNLKKLTVPNPECDFALLYDETLSNGVDDHGNHYFNGIIYSYKGSDVEEFAFSYGYKFVALDGEPFEMSGKCGDDLTWEVSDDGVLTISGTGEMYNYGEEDSIFYNRWDINSIVIKNGVTSIGDYAFTRCTFLENVDIPASVKKMGHSVFYGCKALRNITVPETVTDIDYSVFEKCYYLENVDLPDTMQIIPSFTFDDCKYLKEIKIPDSVTNIDIGAFMACYSLEDVVLPESVNVIGDDAFAFCKALKSVTIKNPECEINDDAATICNNKVNSKCEYSGVIRGYDGSTAQEYAKKNGYKFESLGEYTPEETKPAVTTAVTSETDPSVTSVTEASSATSTTVPSSERVKGDISGNGKIDIYDAIEIAKAIMGVRTFTEEEKAFADINGDGRVNIYDAIAVAMYMIGKK